MTEVCHEWRPLDWSGMAFIVSHTHTVSHTWLCAHSPRHSWAPESPSYSNASIQTHTDTLTELPSWLPPNNSACSLYTLESDTIVPQLTGICLDVAAWCSIAASSVILLYKKRISRQQSGFVLQPQSTGFNPVMLQMIRCSFFNNIISIISYIKGFWLFGKPVRREGHRHQNSCVNSHKNLQSYSQQFRTDLWMLKVWSFKW